MSSTWQKIKHKFRPKRPSSDDFFSYHGHAGADPGSSDNASICPTDSVSQVGDSVQLSKVLGYKSAYPASSDVATRAPRASASNKRSDIVVRSRRVASSDHARTAGSSKYTDRLVPDRPAPSDHGTRAPRSRSNSDSRARRQSDDGPLRPPDYLLDLAEKMRGRPKKCQEEVESLSAQDFDELVEYIKMKRGDQAAREIESFDDAEAEYDKAVARNRSTKTCQTLWDYMEYRRGRVQRVLKNTEQMEWTLNKGVLPRRVMEDLVEISEPADDSDDDDDDDDDDDEEEEDGDDDSWDANDASSLPSKWSSDCDDGAV